MLMGCLFAALEEHVDQSGYVADVDNAVTVEVTTVDVQDFHIVTQQIVDQVRDI